MHRRSTDRLTDLNNKPTSVNHISDIPQKRSRDNLQNKAICFSIESI